MSVPVGAEMHMILAKVTTVSESSVTSLKSSFSSPREIDMLYYVFVRMSRAERLSSSYINLCIFHNLLCFRATCIM